MEETDLIRMEEDIYGVWHGYTDHYDFIETEELTILVSVLYPFNWRPALTISSLIVYALPIDLSNVL